MTDPAPVREDDRIKSLDVVRGLALLGILAVNAAFFAAPYQAARNPLLAPLDIDATTLWSWFVMHVFFDFKMITLFSMLFGASIYLVGGEAGDRDRGRVLYRRLAWLAVFGVIHGALIWYGDILLAYALTGFFVMFARSWPPRRLLVGGIVLVVFSTIVFSGLGVLMQYQPAEAIAAARAQAWTPPVEEVARMAAAYGGGALTSTGENFHKWQSFLGYLPLVMLRTAGVMMLGMALFKMGFFSGKVSNSTYLATAAAGVVALAIVAWQAWINWRLSFDFVHMMGWGTLANTALSPFISLLYASLLILVVKADALRLVTGALAAVGRMALTNYIAQSVIMTGIFYGGRGFGLWGQVDRPALWLFVLAVWIVQLIWSPLWLAGYRMGPLEWLWRRLSYARPLSMARRPQSKQNVVEEAQ